MEAARSTPVPLAVVCHPTLGGSGVVATDIAHGMAARGHAVHLVSSAPPARYSPCHEKLTFHEVTAPSYPVFGDSQYAIALANMLIDLVENHGVRVVHSHYAIPHAVSAHLARMTLGPRAFRSLVSLHGTDVITFGRHPAYARVVQSALQDADVITVPSQALLHRAQEIFALNESRVEVHPNFVDTQVYQPRAPDPERMDAFFPRHTQGAPTLVHISNFRRVKRVGDVLECFAQLNPRVSARLLMVGDGPDRAEAENRCLELGIDDRVRFLGNRPSFHEYLPHCAALILPSEYESFGLAALEALSCGVPVVATAVGGLPEVVREGETGFLVPLGDVEAMARAVESILVDSDTRASMGEAARADALARFDMPVAMNRWEKLYQNISTRS